LERGEEKGYTAKIKPRINGSKKVGLGSFKVA
jgi:hypothetical protein